MGFFNRKKKTKDFLTASSQMADLKRKIDGIPPLTLEGTRSSFDLDTLQQAKALIFITTLKDADKCRRDNAVELIKTVYLLPEPEAIKIVSRLW